MDGLLSYEPIQGMRERTPGGVHGEDQTGGALKRVACLPGGSGISHACTSTRCDRADERSIVDAGVRIADPGRGFAPVAGTTAEPG